MRSLKEINQLYEADEFGEILRALPVGVLATHRSTAVTFDAAEIAALRQKPRCTSSTNGLKGSQTAITWSSLAAYERIAQAASPGAERSVDRDTGLEL